MATSVADILKIENLKLKIRDEKNTNINMLGLESKIYEFLKVEPSEIDEIAQKLGEGVVEIGSTLSIMGIKGMVTESGGKYFLV